MANSHTATAKLLDIAATRKGWRLFPYFVGGVWLGELRKDWKEKLAGFVVELTHARRVTLGRPGVFDRVGFRPVKITPDMVGMTVAQFVTIDAKTQGYKRMSPEQKNYARVVRQAGGFAGIAIEVTDGAGERVVSIAEIGEE